MILIRDEVSKSFHRLSRDLPRTTKQASDARKKSYAAIYQDRENTTLLSKHTKSNRLYRRDVHVFREKDKDVKNIIVRILLALAILVGFGITPAMADGTSPPSCRPPLVCAAR